MKIAHSTFSDLHEAARGGTDAAIVCLLDAGADINNTQGEASHHFVGCHHHWMYSSKYFET